MFGYRAQLARPLLRLDTGWLNFSDAADDGGGGANTALGTVGLALAEDGSGCPHLHGSTAFQNSPRLLVTNCNPDIPDYATILGIEVRAKVRGDQQGGDADIYQGFLKLKSGGAYVGDFKTFGSWPASYTFFSFGSQADKWNTTLTPAIVNANDFGVALQSTNNIQTSTTGETDVIQMKIHYEL
jgi:hypothetical protein